MTGERVRTESSDIDSTTGEQRRFPRLRLVGTVAAGFAVGVALGLSITGEGNDTQDGAPVLVTSPDTTDQGDIDFRFTLDEDIVECRERMQALDDCIASDFVGTDEDPTMDQFDAPYSNDEYITECRELRPLDACIASRP